MLALGTALPTVAMADAVDDLVTKAPDHAMTPTDTLVDNGDGTYDVTLSVTGATRLPSLSTSSISSIGR